MSRVAKSSSGCAGDDNRGADIYYDDDKDDNDNDNDTDARNRSHRGNGSGTQGPVHSPFGNPDSVLPILESGRILQDGFVICGIELRLYTDPEKSDPARGPYSVITAHVRTDRGSIEMTYDKGFRGTSPLENAARLLSENLGPAALVLRSVIALREGIDSGAAAPGKTIFVVY